MHLYTFVARVAKLARLPKLYSDGSVTSHQLAFSVLLVGLAMIRP